MRIGVFGDVHGNAWALEAALKSMKRTGVDLVVFLGDALIRVPAPAETMALLLSVPHLAVRGNYDQFLIDAAAGEGGPTCVPEPFRDEVAWTLEQLSDEELAYLIAMPETIRLFEGEPRSVVVCHGSPGRVSEGLFPVYSHYKRMSDEDCLELLQGEPARTVLAGHTHAVMDRQVGAYHILNPGSISLGWNEEDRMDGLARWGLLEWSGGRWRMQVQAVEYDHASVWQAYEKWPLWPQVRQFTKPRWWAEAARSFAHSLDRRS